MHCGGPGNLPRYMGDPYRHEEFFEGSNVGRQVDLEFDVEKGPRLTLRLILRTDDEAMGPTHSLSGDALPAFWLRAVALDTPVVGTPSNGLTSRYTSFSCFQPERFWSCRHPEDDRKPNRTPFVPHAALTNPIRALGCSFGHRGGRERSR